MLAIAQSFSRGDPKTYPLLGQLAGALVLAVSEQFDDTTLIWCETKQAMLEYPLAVWTYRQDVPRNLLDDLTDKGGPLAEVTLGPRHTGLGNSSLGFL